MLVAASRTSTWSLLAAALVAFCPAQGNVSEVANFPCGMELEGAIDLFGITVFSRDHELWRTDGTIAGTFQLTARQVFGQSVEPPVRMGDHVYFTKWDAATGEELWRTDGTLAGTVMVRDYLPGQTSLEPRELTPVGKYLVFRGQTPPSGGLELYVSDGTFAGTDLLRDIYPGATGSSPSQLTRLGDRVLFLADDGTHGAEFWVTDGTSSGTTLVTDLVPGTPGLSTSPRGVVNGRSLWREGAYSGVRLLGSDGTAAGTMTLHQWSAQLSAYEPLGSCVEVGGRCYFVVAFYHGNNNTSFEIWSTDGQPGGTVGHGQIWPPSYRPGGDSPRLWSLGATLMFEGETANEGHEPWIFDPSSNQFRLVADFDPGSASSRIDGVVPRSASEAILLVHAPLGAGKTVWNIDPTGAAAPVLLRANADSLMPIGARHVWFVAEDGALGYELWQTDGTVGGTLRVAGEAVAGNRGLWIDEHRLSGGRLIMLGDERASQGSYYCGPRVWSVEPAAHTVPLGDPGAGSVGMATLSGEDPVLGSTMQLQLDGLESAPLFAITVDTYSNRATWLDFWFYSGFTAPQVLVWATASGGTGTASVALPANPAFAGLLLQLQGFGLGAPELLASNGLLLVFGY
ncbi:MAG: hypothetical protein KDE27_05845 [Planctomycetes bacterium]|nr:hypothetical protein [Planctomycetota bacterium]